MNSLVQMSQMLKQIWPLSYEPISVRFNDTVPANVSCKPDGSFYSDTACTALCRCLKHGKVLVIAPENNSQGVSPEPCRGAKFFLKLGQVSKEEARRVYVEDEQVFRTEAVCERFLQAVPTYPTSIRGKFIILSPFSQEIVTPQVIVLLVNAVQASKILGLSVCHHYQDPRIIAAAPTCVSLYLPLVDDRVYVNFIDYYDRYYQGKQEDRQLIWAEGDLIVSMTFSLLQAMVKNVDHSPHGNFQPQLKPQPFDPIFGKEKENV